MNVQEFIVGLIVCVCLIGLMRRILHYFKRIRNNESLCDGCPGGCGCQSCEKKDDFIEKTSNKTCGFKK